MTACLSTSESHFILGIFGQKECICPIYNFLKEIHFPFNENAVSFTWPRNAVEVPTQVPFPLDPGVWKRPNLLAPALCQVPARWLRASFLLILTPPKLYFTFSLILQRGDGFKEEKQVTYSHLGSVTTIPYTSCSLTNNNKKLKIQDFISWLPKFCFWIQWHDPAIQAMQGGDWAPNPPAWAGPGAGREKALLPTAVPGVYLSLVQAACIPGNLPPWEAASSWQTQAVFKQTRSAPGGGICPGSWHLVSGYPLLLVLVIGERGGRWSSPLGKSSLGPCSGFLAPSPSGETVSFHQSLMRSLLV